MASSLGMLKSLPCPAGKGCTAFQCLFKHPEDETQAAPHQDTVTATTGADASEVPLATSTNQDSPRKRQRVASPGVRKASARPAVEKAPTPPVQAISPPPLKHKGSATPTQSGKPSPTTQQTKSAQAKPAAAVPKKIETLNARHLGKAPAKHDMRNKLLKVLHESYVRLNSQLKKETKGQGPEAALVLSDQELIVKALDEEEHHAVKKFTIYNNAFKNRITHYKKMDLAHWKEERLASVKKEYGTGEEPKQGPKPIETGLTPEQEVAFLPRLRVDLETLQHFGYIATVPKEGDIEKAEKAVAFSGNFETCDRCTRRFAVFPGRREEDGALASNGPCVYHPGKVCFTPGDRLNERTRKWRCCHQSVGDTNGCTTAENHVFKFTDPARLASVVNFVKTPPNPDAPKNRAVSFDCEMGYTVYGMELIRITAVSWPAGDELLDVLVKPVGQIIDLNTRYSGVRPEDIAKAERWKPGDDHRPTMVPSANPEEPPKRKLKLVDSPPVARDLFFSLISPETPVIAHGAENDLNAVRIVHPMVLDTVLLYPHKKGLPLRNGLKHLMEVELDRKIQVDDTVDKMQGHDSAEDARAAGDLVRLKVKREWDILKRAGWKLVNNEALPPSDSEAWSIPGKKGKAH
ncbi:REX3-RNA exonuclease member of the family of 3'-5' exonuclease [Apiospora kogelbergensis]|uniref:REX3-RNA exonuclease member of the family of 3'-5' exonuclease n=1 Tax=Apiospora kogelbergensis TaxID=1337665 RepID=A0AAW0QXQ9_9PEZI